ncbi:MAG: DUF6680 family protein [Candidatus Aminicenantia bacterium]
MNLNDWLIIGAILIGPILAVQIQKFIESRKEKKNRKMQIFKTLMATRANPLSALHVEALNMIDIEFYDNKEIKEAWKLLLNNFANYPKDANAPDYQTKLDLCSQKSTELLADLLSKMAKSLGYDFDKEHIMRGAYIPQGHADIILDQEIIRRSLVGLFLGQVPIPVKIISEEEKEEEKKVEKVEEENKL